MRNIIARNKEVLSTIYLRYEEFTDDILPALRCSNFHMTSPRIEGDTLYVVWDWDRLGTRVTHAIKWEDGELPEAFDNKLQAYLFRLTVSIINL